MLLFQLFLSFLMIGALSFGGGYAAVPLIQNQIVNLHGWMDIKEFSNLITISQMTPGPIAINSATFVGLKMDGIAGAAIATLGCVIPSCIIVTIIAHYYLKYKNLSIIKTMLNTLRPAVVALIATAGVSITLTAFFGTEGIMTLEHLHLPAVFLFGLSIYLLKGRKQNPIMVMIIAGALQAGFYALTLI